MIEEQKLASANEGNVVFVCGLLCDCLGMGNTSFIT